MIFMIRLIVKLKMSLAKRLKNRIMMVNLANLMKNRRIGFVTFPAIFQLMLSDQILCCLRFYGQIIKRQHILDGYFY